MPEDTIKREDYAPITWGLREYIERHPTMMHAVGLTDLCDNIDAIHKSLKEQNAKLREKVLNQRKQLAEVQEAIERRNNGVLKRRWQKKMDALKNENEEMRNFNCRVREAIRRHEDLTLWGRDYTELPLDADGEYIHIGDVMENLREDLEPKLHHRFKVYGIQYREYGQVCALTEDGYPSILYRANECRHYHAPTVADVLWEFAQAMAENSDMYVSEAIDADERQEADERAIEYYAKRLQLAEVEGE